MRIKQAEVSSPHRATPMRNIQSISDSRPPPPGQPNPAPYNTAYRTHKKIHFTSPFPS